MKSIGLSRCASVIDSVAASANLFLSAQVAPLVPLALTSPSKLGSATLEVK